MGALKKICAIVLGDGASTRPASKLLAQRLGHDCPVLGFTDTASALAHLDSIAPGPDGPPPVVIVLAGVGPGSPTADEMVRPLADLPQCEHTRFMVLTESLELSGVEWLTDNGHLDWVGYAPDLEPEVFLQDVDAQIHRFKEHQKPTSYFSVSSLFDNPHSDGFIVERVLEQIEQSLGPQPRIRLPRGTRLTTKGRWVEEVTIVIKGRVALLHETPLGDEIVMHEESTGRIIGLLAVSEGRRALLDAVTSTDVIGVRLTVEQLNAAITGHPDITLLVATLFIRSLDRRLRRAEALHIENAELSEQLEKEREQLATALFNLEEARTELTAQERLASLGALSAGVAHELNNPMAAIKRISEYLGDDVTTLLEGAPGKRWSTEALQALNDGMNAPALSTKAERQLRREFAEVVGDPQAASNLVIAGLRDPALVKRLNRRHGITLADAEKAASIGTQLRNLRSASTRITELVSSLRSYARPDTMTSADMNLHQNLDDALRLLTHKLDGVEVVREYQDLPEIEGHEGQLAQVWTNVVSNAAEAIVEAAQDSPPPPEPERVQTTTGSIPVVQQASEPLGNIIIRTSSPKPGWVRVEIVDDGPGIPSHILPHVFEPRFTTKSGQVRFGMGIGLGVARSIVGKHHGTMRICTSDEGTTVVVDLPIETPKEGP